MARSDPDPLPDRPGDGGEPAPGARIEHAGIPAGHPLRWVHACRFPLSSDPRFLPLPAPRGWNPRSGSEIFEGAMSSRGLLRHHWHEDPFGLVSWCMHRVESEHRRPRDGFHCIDFAMQRGLRHECLAEARQVDATMPDSPAVSQWLAVVYEGRVAREWSPTSEGRGLARDLLHSLGPTAKRIAHVLQ